jgi:hypothetical protein
LPPETPIRIDPPTAEAQRLWAKAIELAEAFGEKTNWCLVGGLMVQLHGYERGAESRPTSDIDFLGDSRQRPKAGTKRLAETLDALGAKMTWPPRSSPDLGYQFEIDGELVEILGSEGVEKDPATLGSHKTLQVPGGTQALRRTESVPVSLNGGDPVLIRRPDLLGAILIKARAVDLQRDKFGSDREDLIRLLGFVADPRALARDGGLKRTERKWLRKAEGMMRFDDAELGSIFPLETLNRARQALALMTS